MRKKIKKLSNIEKIFLSCFAHSAFYKIHISGAANRHAPVQYANYVDFQLTWAEGSGGAYSIGRLRCPSVVRRPSTISNDFSSETTGPIATKFHIQPPGTLQKKNYSNGLDHMTNITAMPIYGKNLKKSSSPEPIDQWPWNLVCSIVCGSTTKIVQIMTLGWSWPILRQGQIWSHKLLYGKKWKSFIFWKLLQPWVSKLLEAFN